MYIDYEGKISKRILCVVDLRALGSLESPKKDKFDNLYEVR